MNKKRKIVPKVQEEIFEIELEEETEKVVEQEPPKKKIKTVRIGDPLEGWKWMDIEE